MMTFKDLKNLVELPSYKEQRVPTVKALEVSGVPVVTEKVLENHGSINVYQNGYVIYRAHKRVTVFSLRDCVHYKYDAAEGAGHHIEEEEFDEYEWHIRLVLEGEDRIFMPQKPSLATATRCCSLAARKAPPSRRFLKPWARKPSTFTTHRIPAATAPLLARTTKRPEKN